MIKSFRCISLRLLLNQEATEKEHLLYTKNQRIRNSKKQFSVFKTRLR